MTGTDGTEDPAIAASHEAKRTIEDVVADLRRAVAELGDQVDRWKMENGACNPEPRPAGHLPASDETLAAISDGMLAASADNLAGEVAHLRAGMAAQIDALTKEREARETAQKKTWWQIFWAYVINGAHIVATALVLIFGIGYVHAQQQIEVLVTKLDRSIHSQCGTLQLLIKSYRGAPPQGSPIDPAEYRDSYIKIQRQADEIECGIPHVVPGT